MSPTMTVRFSRAASSLFEDVVHQSILGTQDFVKWVKKKLPRKGQRAVPSKKKLLHHISVDQILEEVAKAGNVQVD